MDASQIRCIRMAREENRANKYGPAVLVMFRIGTDVDYIDIPIWLPPDTPDDKLLALGRKRLHEITRQVADRTKEWAQ